jgi:hypothetical protein
MAEDKSTNLDHSGMKNAFGMLVYSSAHSVLILLNSSITKCEVNSI